jgi:hypothetical protein
MNALHAASQMDWIIVLIAKEKARVPLRHTGPKSV